MTFEVLPCAESDGVAVDDRFEGLYAARGVVEWIESITVVEPGMMDRRRGLAYLKVPRSVSLARSGAAQPLTSRGHGCAAVWHLARDNADDPMIGFATEDGGKGDWPTGPSALRPRLLVKTQNGRPVQRNADSVTVQFPDTLVLSDGSRRLLKPLLREIVAK